jgi:hypothetical protein
MVARPGLQGIHAAAAAQQCCKKQAVQTLQRPVQVCLNAAGAKSSEGCQPAPVVCQQPYVAGLVGACNHDHLVVDGVPAHHLFTRLQGPRAAPGTHHVHVASTHH